MHDGHFVFLGYRYYRLKRGRARDALVRDGEQRPRHTPREQDAQDTGAHRSHRSPAQAGPRARAAGAHQGQHAFHGAPRELPRLRRRQDVRRGRRSLRRTPLPGSLDVERVSQAAIRDSAVAPQARCGHPALRAARAEPRRQVRRQRHRNLSARRIVPDAGRRAHSDRARHRQPLRTPPRAAVRAPRQLRTFLFLPRVRAARPLQHRGARTHRAHRAPAFWRHARRNAGADLRLHARPPAHAGAHAARRRDRRERRRASRPRSPRPRPPGKTACNTR